MLGWSAAIEFTLSIADCGISTTVHDCCAKTRPELREIKRCPLCQFDEGPTKIAPDVQARLEMLATCRRFETPQPTDMPTCRRHVGDTTQTMSATWHRVGSSDAVSVSCQHDNLPTCLRRVVDHGRRPPCPLPPPMPLQRPIHRFETAGYIICDVVCAPFAQNRAGSTFSLV
jgi:hypothetical protein